MFENKTSKKLDYIIIGLFFILLIGTPLIFTSYTRSVFEVGKLLLVRIVIILTYIFWLLKSMYVSANSDQKSLKKEEHYTIFGFKWKKIGLEIPIILVLLTNILSTIFSQNLKLSIIGSYDRWEGIITIVNYLMLYLMFAKLMVKRVYFYWIMAGLVIPSGLSSIYGIYQSVGWDFMNWSVDPSARVFACINNPVHFCAYVAMIVPIGIAWLLYSTSKQKTSIMKNLKLSNAIKWTLFSLSLLLIHIPETVFDNVDTTLFFDGPAILNFLSIFAQGVWSVFTVSIYKFFSSPNISGILILSSAWFVCLKNNVILPNKQFIIHWSLYFFGLLTLYSLKIIVFTPALWVTLSLFIMLYFILSALPDIGVFTKRGTLVFTTLVFYAVFLSFSRATWLAFMGAGILFYLFSLKSFSLKSEKAFIKDFLLTSVFIAIYFLYHVFHIELVSIWAGIVTFSLIIAYLLYYFSQEVNKTITTLAKNEYANFITLILLTYLTFLFNWQNYFTSTILIILKIVLSSYFIYFCKQSLYKRFLSRIIIVLIFVNIQSIIVSFDSIISYFALVIASYFVLFKGNVDLMKEQKFWLFSLLIIFGLSFSLPSLPSYINSFSKIENSNAVKSLKLAKFRAGSYKQEAQKDTARGSMWKSGMPWFKDHFLIGSGLDTVKYMYPVYRRSEYGILEGGHNFTPDRLHNEYINTLSTKGILGFVAYYFLFIIPWYALMLKGYYRFRNHRYHFFISAFICSCSIYLGQVVFNFGVVATLVLFYILMACGHALVTHPSFKDEINRDEEKVNE